MCGARGYLCQLVRTANNDDDDDNNNSSSSSNNQQRQQKLYDLLPVFVLLWS